METLPFSLEVEAGTFECAAGHFIIGLGLMRAFRHLVNRSASVGDPVGADVGAFSQFFDALREFFEFALAK